MVQKDREEPSKYKQSYSSFNRKKVTWNKINIMEYKRLTNEALSQASAFWKDPEATPLLCVLYSDLLVKCADLASEQDLVRAKSKTSGKSLKKSRNLSKEEAILLRKFKEWKRLESPGQNQIQLESLMSVLVQIFKNLEDIKKIWALFPQIMS